MLKLFYRLKRKHGAVLFFVVAVMSLLIAMATTAYYTARSSYKTVVSNYDYSQLYLSAVSVSDMVMDAVTNETSTPYVDGDSSKGTLNNYSTLRDAMLTMAKNSAKSGTTVAPIVAKSANIKDITSTDVKDIMEAAAANPTHEGIVDGVTVTINYIGTDQNLATLSSGDHDVKFYFTIETTAYYKNNTITVKDTLYNTMTVKVSGGSSTPDPVKFSRFFTATGQQLINGGTEVNKNVSRKVVIKTHSISDDAYFENPYTVFVNGNDNAFLGGLTSAGSLYLDKFTCGETGGGIPNPSGGDRNDWFIGQDLVIVGANAQNLNLQENDLYINGDLYVPNQATITARNIYVGGNVYFHGNGGKGGGTINGKLFVNGNIYYSIPDDKGTVINGILNGSGASFDKGYTDQWNPGGAWDSGSNPVNINGSLACNGSVDSKYENKLKVNNVVVSGGTANWDPSNTPAEISVKVEEGGEFVKKLQNTKDDGSPLTVQDAMKSQIQTTDYPNYTSKESALTNNLDIIISRDYATEAGFVLGEGTDDLKNVYVKMVNGAIVAKVTVPKDEGLKNNITAEFYPYTVNENGTVTVGTSATTANINTTGNGSVSVNVPYDDKGYLLDIQGASNVQSLDYQFNADNSEPVSGVGGQKVQQVVLKSNYENGGDKGFSWKGNPANNSSDCNVMINGGGKLALELGNYDTTTGKYVTYDPTNSNIKTVTYYVSEKEAVGTRDQILDALKGGDTTKSNDYQNPTQITSIIGSESKPTQDKYDNKVMLISNKNGGTAINAQRLNNTFFGIMYAPNADYDSADSNGGNVPIVGGLVASTYRAELANFIYSEPDPDDLRDIFGSLGGSGGSSPPGTPSTPTITDVTEGDWKSEGSTFIG